MCAGFVIGCRPVVGFALWKLPPSHANRFNRNLLNLTMTRHVASLHPLYRKGSSTWPVKQRVHESAQQLCGVGTHGQVVGAHLAASPPCDSSMLGHTCWVAVAWPLMSRLSRKPLKTVFSFSDLNSTPQRKRSHNAHHCRAACAEIINDMPQIGWNSGPIRFKYRMPRAKREAYQNFASIITFRMNHILGQVSPIGHQLGKCSAMPARFRAQPAERLNAVAG